MKLFIVESPAKAKTIGKYLGKNFVVKASVGHIRDLPKSNKEAIDIEGGFIPKYQIVPGKEKVIAELKKEAKRAEEIILATDQDREGEAISWHIMEALELRYPKAKRITYNEITKEAIGAALMSPRSIDFNLKKAQEARRVLDRLFGYGLSGLIWQKVRYGLSAGRVQSPALRIIMEREREIRAFVPKKYHILSASCETKNKEKFTLLTEEIWDPQIAEETLKKGKTGDWFVKGIKETKTERAARAPFITSTLQQAASSQLGFSPGRTMSLAQRLYEAGAITYMRTDSVNLATSAQKEILEFVRKEYGDNFAQVNLFKTKSKTAQEAHEAIRPTKIFLKTAGDNEDQQKLYKLIWTRTVASQMKPAEIMRTKITANIKEGDISDFSANGNRVVFPGWLLADPGAKGEEVELPKVNEGDLLKLLELNSEEKETAPPSRFTEAGLIKELEKREIGRPSTYATIIETLSDRKYVNKENRTLFPTDTGEVVSDFLEKNFGNYISDSFTALMEDELDDIALGKCEYVKTLKDFYTPFSKTIKEKEKLEKATTLGEAPEEIKCPKCGGSMVIKLGRGGKFYSCSKYPDCDGALTIEGKLLEGPKETGEICPECGEKKGGKLVLREGRFGKFISCSRYPKCKYIKKSKEEEERAKTGVACPLCKKGEIVERRGRFGPFYSCSRYPDCKFAMKAKPTGRVCELCGSLMMEGTKTIPERCSNKDCRNYNPNKKIQ